MTLIQSISGIRGTIGGKVNESLTPADIVRYTAAFGTWLKKKRTQKKYTVVTGRDARVSGEMVSSLVTATFQALGIDVVDIGLSTTPTVEIAVKGEKADGGIVITASHNPKQWNALKLLNAEGEFISESDGQEVLTIAAEESYVFADVNSLGKAGKKDTWIQKHIDRILALPLVDVKAIRARKFKVVIDCVNSSGSIVLPRLLESLGVEEVVKIHCEPDGIFPHNPEPLPENLADLSKTVVKKKAHLGIAVDPDVDRLALVCEDGEMFGEEYTLVSVADFVLQHKKGNTVSNMSSTRALKDVTEKAGCSYYASAVGEVNVVRKMKEVQAVIGGEGNGGIILPEFHYGRDALAGIALFLTQLARSGKTASLLRSGYPDYYISKNKIELTPDINVEHVLNRVREKYKKHPANTEDGVKIDFGKEWVHLRRSNTEPIIRIYSESESQSTAENLAEKIISDIREIIKSQQIAV